MTPERKLELMAQDTKEARTYHARLMQILERAVDTDMDITVSDGHFVITEFDSRDSDYDTHYTLSINYSEANEKILQYLKLSVERAEQEIAKASRDRELRKQALSKLSKEEREVLGLVDLGLELWPQ